MSKGRSVCVLDDACGYREGWFRGNGRRSSLLFGEGRELGPGFNYIEPSTKGTAISIQADQKVSRQRS